jgi:hypothetical protein
MTKRRSAERAIIDAAMRWRAARQGVSYVAEQAAQDLLMYRLGELDALELEPATAARTTSLPMATSEAAAHYMSKSVHRVVGQVFAQILLVHQQGAIGLTTDAIEQRLSRSHQSVSPRVTDLRDQGWVEPAMSDGGHPLTRSTRYGQQATVWKPTDAAIEAARHVDRWCW